MKLYILGVGIAGQPPVNHTYKHLWQRMEAQTPQSLPCINLPALLRRERKIQIIAQAADMALEPIKERPELLQQCGFVVTTCWDGRFPTMFDTRSNRIISFTDLPPSSVALSVVAHVAESCIPMYMNMQGPALTMSSYEGLVAAIKVAGTMLLAERAPIMLVQEFDLALPSNLRQQGLQPEHDYAISVLLSQQNWGEQVIGELTI